MYIEVTTATISDEYLKSYFCIARAKYSMWTFIKKIAATKT